MQVRDQTLDEIKASLSPLTVEWMDDAAREAMALLAELPVKDTYDRNDVAAMLDQGFDRGILCARLFLMLSKDAMTTALSKELPEGYGAKRYKADRETFLDALDRLGLPDKMAATINYQPIWSDILKERLRSGRGSAIQGQKRGRGLEDFTEVLVREVFGDAYETRCTFAGRCAVPCGAVASWTLRSARGAGAAGRARHQRSPRGSRRHAERCAAAGRSCIARRRSRR